MVGISRLLAIAVAVVVLGFAGGASAQVVTFNFEDLTDQGFGAGFGDDASRTFPIDFVGGSNRMRVLRTGAFQEAGRQSGNPAEPFFSGHDGRFEQRGRLSDQLQLVR